MKIEKAILKEVCAEPLAIAQRNKTGPNSCVKLENIGGKFTVYGSNGSQSAAFTAEAKEAGDDFSAIFPADSLRKILDSFDRLVEINLEGNTLVFRERAFVRRARAAGYRGSEFFFPSERPSESFKISAPDLSALFNDADANLCERESNTAGSYVRFFCDGDALRIDATDRRVVLCRDLPRPSSACPKFDAFLPPEAVRFLRSVDSDAEISFAARAVKPLPKPKGYVEGVDDPPPPPPAEHLLVVRTPKSAYFSTLGDGLSPLACRKTLIPASDIFSVRVYDALELFRKFAQYDAVKIEWGGDLATEVKLSAKTRSGEDESSILFDAGEVFGSGEYYLNPRFAVSVLQGFSDKDDAAFKIASAPRSGSGGEFLALQIHSGISRAVIAGIDPKFV